MLGLSSTALSLTKSVVNIVVATLTIAFLTLFMLLEGPAWVERIFSLFPARSQPRWRRVGGEIYRTVGGYVTGNLTISLIAGVVSTAVLLGVGVDYAVALGLLVAILDLIPLAGATIAAVLVSTIAFLHSVTAGIIVLVFFLVYQQVENHILQPLVYGRTVKLSPLAVLVSVLIGAELAGIIGALGAIPIAGLDPGADRRPARASPGTDRRAGGRRRGPPPGVSFSAYVDLARRPHVVPLFAWSLVARLPVAMTSLAILLAARHEGYAYGTAGLIVATYTVGIAVGAPLVGRQLDRRGPVRVLRERAVVFAAALVAIAALFVAGAPPVAAAAAGAVVGVSMPPVGSALRSLWGAVVEGPRSRRRSRSRRRCRRCTSPSGRCSSRRSPWPSPVLALVAAAAGTLVGTFALTALPPFAGAVPGRGEERARSLLGALRSAGVRTIVGFGLCVGVGFGAMEIVLPAFAEAHGGRAVAGIVVACFSAGSLAGGLLAGARPAVDQRRRMRRAALLLVPAFAVPLLATSVPVMCVCVFVAGMPIAPRVRGDLRDPRPRRACRARSARRSRGTRRRSSRASPSGRPRQARSSMPRARGRGSSSPSARPRRPGWCSPCGGGRSRPSAEHRSPTRTLRGWPRGALRCSGRRRGPSRCRQASVIVQLSARPDGSSYRPTFAGAAPPSCTTSTTGPTWPVCTSRCCARARRRTCSSSSIPRTCSGCGTSSYYPRPCALRGRRGSRADVSPHRC